MLKQPEAKLQCNYVVNNPKVPTLDSYHIVTSLSNRFSIEKSTQSFLQIKGQTLPKHILIFNTSIFGR